MLRSSGTVNHVLVLHSSKAVRKESAQMAPRFRRSSPDPRFGSVVELLRGGLPCPVNLVSIGKTLVGERVTAEEAPPALLQIQPTRAFGNEHLLDARMVRQPGARLQAVVTAQVVGDNENIARRIVSFDVFEELNVVLGVARRGTPRDLFAIAYPQCAIDPDLLVTTTVLKRGFDAMTID
jgi:hypothetical protein